MDDHFTSDHGSCCIGDRVSFHANNITDSVDGIELEAVASEAPPRNSAQLSQLSKLLKDFEFVPDAPPFEVVMRLTAVPSNTDFWREISIRSQATSDTRFAWCPKIICNYCPGFEYSLFQHRNNELHIDMALRRHCTNALHYERVRRRRRVIRGARLEAGLAT